MSGFPTQVNFYTHPCSNYTINIYKIFCYIFQNKEPLSLIFIISLTIDFAYPIEPHADCRSAIKGDNLELEMKIVKFLASN